MLRRSRFVCLIAMMALWSLSSPLSALIINDDDFIANGGHMDDIGKTIARAMDFHRHASYLPPFLAVGRVILPDRLCTGTWLGNSRDGRYTYVLTAAYCVKREYNTSKPLSGELKALFIDWNKRLIGQNGHFIVTPTRIQSGYGNASTNLAILRMERRDDILDAEGQPIEKPIINTRMNEAGKQVWLAGYGAWGTGSGDERARYRPRDHLERRAAASSRILEGFSEQECAMSAGFIPNIASPYQARTAMGDIGSAWWMRNDEGQWTIVGVSSGHSRYASLSTRIGMYVLWLQLVYPDTRTY